ncbi:MAG: hypothetical protein ACLTEE_14955 [Anaerobutyricum hallii]
MFWRKKNEGFKTASKVQYVASAGCFEKEGQEYHGALKVLKTIFSYDYLWVNVRVTGGAYGCMCNFSRNGYGFFLLPTEIQTFLLHWMFIKRQRIM